jgi:hypothetical protein
VLLETETDTERRENLLAARFRDTERESAGVGLRDHDHYYHSPSSSMYIHYTKIIHFLRFFNFLQLL